MRRVSKWCLGAVLLSASLASAHEFTCEEMFDGRKTLEVSTYPATIEAKVRVTNSHPTSTSVAMEIHSIVLDYLGDRFDSMLPVPVGGYAEKTLPLVIHSFEHCKYLASLDGVADYRLVAPVSVKWDLGNAKCWAEIICKPQTCEVPE